MAGELLIASGGGGGLVGAERDAREEGMLTLVRLAGAGEIEEGEAGFIGVGGALARGADQGADQGQNEAAKGAVHEDKMDTGFLEGKGRGARGKGGR